MRENQSMIAGENSSNTVDPGPGFGFGTIGDYCRAISARHEITGTKSESMNKSPPL